jgi:hypothetical protein
MFMTDVSLAYRNLKKKKVGIDHIMRWCNMALQVIFERKITPRKALFLNAPIQEKQC